MLPRSAAKTPITVYNYLLSKANPGAYFYRKTVLPDCVWQQDSEATYRKTGVPNKDAIKLLIPFNPEYFSVQNDQVYTGDGWTIQMGPELAGTYIVKGFAKFRFPDEDNPNYFHEYVQKFETEYKYFRPKEIIEHLVGSRNMWYIEVRC